MDSISIKFTSSMFFICTIKSLNYWYILRNNVPFIYTYSNNFRDHIVNTFQDLSFWNIWVNCAIVIQHMAAFLEQWVNDELYTLVGCSDRIAVQYILALARKSTNAEDLFERLRSTGTLEDTPAVRKFTNELIARVPHAG